MDFGLRRGTYALSEPGAGLDEEGIREGSGQTGIARWEYTPTKGGSDERYGEECGGGVGGDGSGEEQSRDWEASLMVESIGSCCCLVWFKNFMAPPVPVVHETLTGMFTLDWKIIYLGTLVVISFKKNYNSIAFSLDDNDLKS
jgi:hypothetical protein